MTIFAVVQNNEIINTIVADSKVIAENVTNKLCIDMTGQPFGIGDIWDGQNFLKKDSNNAEI